MPRRKPRLGKNFLVDLALLAQFHLLLEDIDLAAQLDGNLGAKFFFPAQAAFHKTSSAVRFGILKLVDYSCQKYSKKNFAQRSS